MTTLSVIILAGGASSRFFPLNEKNLYPFLGKTSLEIHIPHLMSLNPEKVVVVTNSSFQTKFTKIGQLINSKIVHITPQSGTGMAGAILSASKLIRPTSQLLILNANDYFEESLYENFRQKHNQLLKEGACAIAAYKTSAYFPGGYLTLSGENITGIVEKPGQGNEPSDYVNLVFHYFPQASLITDALPKAKSSKDDVYEVALDNLMKSGQKFQALKYNGKWATIKYSWHVLDVMDFFLASIKGQKISKSAQISKFAHIKGPVLIEDGVKVFEGAVISGPAYLGKNVVVGNNALIRESMIGEGSVIGFATEVARSYFKSNVWLHKNYVGDSVFEDNISLGSNALTANLRLDEKNIKVIVKDDLIDTGRNKVGAIIGSNVRIGVSANLMPGVKIGQGSFVGPNTLIAKDLPENSFAVQKTKLTIIKNNFVASIKSRESLKKALHKN